MIKNELKESVLKVIEELRRKNRIVRDNISNEDVLEIYNKLGEKANLTIRGFEHYLLKRDVAIRALDKEIGIKEDKLIKEAFVYHVHSATLLNIVEAPVFYKLYLTKEKLILCKMDYFFTLVYKEEFPINKIKVAGTTKYVSLIKEDSWYIDLDGKEKFYLVMGNEKMDKLMLDFIKKLNELGVKKIGSILN